MSIGIMVINYGVFLPSDFHKDRFDCSIQDRLSTCKCTKFLFFLLKKKKNVIENIIVTHINCSINSVLIGIL